MLLKNILLATSFISKLGHAVCVALYNFGEYVSKISAGFHPEFMCNNNNKKALFQSSTLIVNLFKKATPGLKGQASTALIKHQGDRE